MAQVAFSIYGDRTHRYLEDSDSSSTCPRGAGFYRDAHACDHFHRCVDDGEGGYRVYEFQCGEETVFDERYDVCNWPRDTPPPCGTAGEEDKNAGSSGSSENSGSSGSSENSGQSEESSAVKGPSTTQAPPAKGGKGGKGSNTRSQLRFVPRPISTTASPAPITTSPWTEAPSSSSSTVNPVPEADSRIVQEKEENSRGVKG